jgi:hypothetical protein
MLNLARDSLIYLYIDMWLPWVLFDWLILSLPKCNQMASKTQNVTLWAHFEDELCSFSTKYLHSHPLPCRSVQALPCVFSVVIRPIAVIIWCVCTASPRKPYRCGPTWPTRNYTALVLNRVQIPLLHSCDWGYWGDAAASTCRMSSWGNQGFPALARSHRNPWDITPNQRP